MSEKSHVSMERQVCLICTTEFDTGAILLHRRLRPCLERYTVTGWGLCVEHQRLFDDGFVALVECRLSQGAESGAAAEAIDPGHVRRTGRVAHMKREAFSRLFQAEIAPTVPCVFIEPGVMEQLETLNRASVTRS
jgi:hypothetical protein